MGRAVAASGQPGSMLRLGRWAALVVAMLCATKGDASTLDVQPLEFPLELRDVAAQLIQAGQGQFIAMGNRDGSCLVARLDPQLRLLVLRRLPDASCLRASVDSFGDIIILIMALTPNFPYTFDLDPQRPSSHFMLKLGRSSLETKSGTRLSNLGWRATVTAMAVAPDDSIWIGGYGKQGLVTTPDAIQSSYPGSFIELDRDQTGFLIRVSPDGQRLSYSTYLWSLRSAVGAISIDNDGNVYAAGRAIWKFSPQARLIWSTWLPPSSTLGSAIGRDGDLYLVGTTEAGGLYTTPGAFQMNSLSPVGNFLGNLFGYPAGSVDGFVARISPGGDVIYSTLMGGIRADSIGQVIVGADGSALVSGVASGNLFPTRSAFAMGPGSVLARLSPDGTTVAFSTYLTPNLSNPVPSTEGGYVMLSYSSIGSILQTSAYRVTELPDSLPRIDTVLDATQPGESLAAGANATISGEGFSVVTEVTVGDVPVRIVSQSDCLLEIEMPAILPGQTPQSAFTGQVRLLRGSEVLRHIRVQVRSVR